MSLTVHNPEGIAAPFSHYSHGVTVTGAASWLITSGQVGVAPDGTVPDDAERQFELAWDNLFAVVADAGMSVPDLVKVDGFVTRADLVPLYRTVRERRLAGHATASTLIVVAGLAAPNLLVEVQGIAAK